MSKHSKEILDLIARNPGIRTVEIADMVDCDIEHVEVAIKAEINSGFVVTKSIVAPNGRQQNSYRMIELKTKEDAS